MRSALPPLTLVAALVGVGIAVGCAPTATTVEVPDSASTVVLSVQNLDCGGCGEDTAARLQKDPAVYTAAFDRSAVELTVQYDATRTGPEQLVALALDSDEEGLRVTIGAGAGAYQPEVVFDAGLDVLRISEAGEAVDVGEHLAEGKVTVVDFYAPWCKPCREVDHHMKKVLAAPDVALRKVNVVDWDTPVAKRYLGSVPDLPYVVVYSRKGRPIAKISGLDLARLDAAIEKGRGK